MKAFCLALPKCELHAHLSGSIRKSTLRKWAAATASELEEELRELSSTSLSDCFRVFDIIHRLVHSGDQVQQCVKEMMEDNFDDGCWYLEVRTTPRILSDFTGRHATTRTLNLPRGTLWLPTKNASSENLFYHDNESKEIEAIKNRGIESEETYKVEVDENLDAALAYYVENVIAAIVKFENGQGYRDISRYLVTRLILSINRTGSIESAANIIKLAKICSNIFMEVPSTLGHKSCKAFSKIVVGIEISGDPTRGNLEPILSLLHSARNDGLKISIHGGEVENFSETNCILDFAPDRLGHMCVLAPNILDRMLARSPQIPIELCPSSNIVTLRLPTIEAHPTLKNWIDKDYPLCLSTDDSGVFDVTLSSEYKLVSEALELSMSSLARLSLASFNYSFCESELLHALHSHARKQTKVLLDQTSTTSEL
jgi:adenosine deaminase